MGSPMTALDRLYLTLASPSANDDEVNDRASRSVVRSHQVDGAAVTESSVRDHALLQGLREDDEQAFGDLFDAYWEPLCRHARRILHSSDAAHDVVQDVLLRV